MTAVIVVRLARCLYGTNEALWAAWLIALSPMLAEFATEGRPYAMLAFFSTAMTYHLLCFMKREGWKSMLFLVATAMGGLLTHYIFIVHAAFAAGYYLLVRRRPTKYSVGASLLVSPVVAVLTWGILHNMAQSAGLAQYSSTKLSSLLTFLARVPIAMSFGLCTFRLPHLSFGRNIPVTVIHENVLLLSIVAVASVILAWQLLRLLLQRREGIGFLCCSIVVPGILFLLGILGNAFVAREKYLIGILGTYLVLMAVVFSGARRSWLLRGGVVAYIIVVAVSLVHYVAYPNVYSRRMYWTGVRRLLCTEMAAGDVLVFYRADNDATRDVAPATGGIQTIDVQAESQEGANPTEIVSRCAERCHGRIFLVNNEIHRVSIDPRQHVINTLKRERAFQKHDFGRNLSVYIFLPRPETTANDRKA